LFKGFLVVLVVINFIIPTHAAHILSSSRTIQDQEINVFIDCYRCDMNFIRTQISFVNYVNSRQDADIHIILTYESTAGSGWEHTLVFLGQQNFVNMTDTLAFVSAQGATQDDTRNALVSILKMGLMRFVSKTSLANQISILYTEPREPLILTDKWDHWVFRTSVNGSYKGEKSSESIDIRGGLSANRITDDWKIRSSLDINYDEDHFETDDTNITSFSKSQKVSGLIVKSLSEHWSAGISSTASTSTYSNLKVAYEGAPAIEYNYYPYSESTYRELRFLYQVGYRYNYYDEMTVYEKTKEGLLQQALTIDLEVKQPWGSIDTRLKASNYFKDFEKNRLEFSSRISLSLFRGFSLNLWGSYTRIHDQLSLPRGDVSTEEILLRRKQLSTQYRFSSSLGFSYTFGSIYNNIVNPRFGQSSGSSR
jgi:hypothetical protein